MSFCPRCGAPTTPAMSFCTACGETLAPAVYPQGAAAPIPAATEAAPAAPRAKGVTQEPALVVVLTLVTLGIYQYVYWWRVSKEIDAYRGVPGHAHKPIRIATYLGIALGVLGLVAMLAFFGAMASNMGAIEDGGPGSEEALVAAMAPMLVFFPLLALASLVAFIFLLVGEWRVWAAIETEERARHHPKPLSPIVQLVFMIVPYVNLVTMFVALYKTQSHLNQLWAQDP